MNNTLIFFPLIKTNNLFTLILMDMFIYWEKPLTWKKTKLVFQENKENFWNYLKLLTRWESNCFNFQSLNTDSVLLKLTLIHRFPNNAKYQTKNFSMHSLKFMQANFFLLVRKSIWNSKELNCLDKSNKSC